MLSAGRRLAGWRAMLAERRSVAALELAIVTPVLLTLGLGLFDLARAISVGEQLNDAAEAIAEAAEKLSVTMGANGPITALTPVQMQAAMSTIYAEIPGLQWGNGQGNYPGSFAVTLSSIVYMPWCTTNSDCQPQSPYTAWSAYFNEAGSGQLNTNNTGGKLWRPCDVALTPVPQFTDDSRQLSEMLVPAALTPGAVLIPQIVADVRYDFTPSFPITFGHNVITLWASATLPAPLGKVTQYITDTIPNGGAPSYLQDCGIQQPPNT